MLEKDFVSVMVSSVKSRGGFANKFPDPSFAELKRGAPKRPYDMNYVLNGPTVHVEAKFLKGYQAFNLGRVEEHQYENLLLIAHNDVSERALVAVAIWEAHKIYDVYFFTITLLNELKKTKTSINKKTLLALKETGRVLTISKSDLPIELLPEVIICDTNQIPWA